MLQGVQYLFIDIDRSRSPEKPRFFLAKPNKQIITNLTANKREDSVTIKLGDIGELNFTIPYYIDNDFESTYNKDIDLIKEKMLIKMKLGTYTEWFIIDSIEDVGDENEYTSITAFSLGFELSHRRIPFYEKDSVSAKEFLSDMLENTAWTIGTISSKLDNVRRSFDITDSNAMESISQASESFDALVYWDTVNREVSFLDLEENGKFRGMTANYGRLLRSISRSRETDELVTRMYVYGNEDLSIHNVNPTGQPYLEDFSYFMYPFEQDSQGNVIKSSYFMSDELCIALTNHSKLVEDSSQQYRDLTEQRKTLSNERVTKEVQMIQLLAEKGNLEDRLDVAKATENNNLIITLTAELSEKNSQINSLQTEIDNLKQQMLNIDNQIKFLTDTLLKESNFTEELIDELNFYVIEKEFRDDRYINEEELYIDALKKFKESREPKVVISIDIDNFFNILEEQYYWDKLVLGDMIKVKYPQMNMEYMARIVEINFDFESDDISLVIANTEKADSMDKLKEILNNTKTATSILQNGKYKWDKINEINDEVYRLINSEIDATKNKIIAGINNEIEIGRRGIILRNPDYPSEVVILQSGVIALSEDGGETWRTAIKPSGIVAERLIGNIIIGRNLVITNGDNSFVFDNDGMKVDANKFVVTSATSEKPFQMIISEFESRFEVAEDRISLVVTEDNKLRGEQLVSAINVQPESIKISSKNVSIDGIVTFNALDFDMKNRFNIFESTSDLVADWRYPNTTTIDGGVIQANTIGASQIRTNELVVGENISMSPNAVISWDSISGKPIIPNDTYITQITQNTLSTSTIRANQILIGGANGSISFNDLTNKPTATSLGAHPNTWMPTASQVGAKPSSYSAYDDIGYSRLTHITSTGVYTGTLTAGQINAVTISANTIRGGTLSGVYINVDNDVTIGNNIYLNARSFSDRFSDRGLYFLSRSETGYEASIKATYLRMDISHDSTIRVYSNDFDVYSDYLRFSGRANFNGGLAVNNNQGMTVSGTITATANISTSGNMFVGSAGLFSSSSGYVVLRGSSGYVLLQSDSEVRATTVGSISTYQNFRANSIYAENNLLVTGRIINVATYSTTSSTASANMFVTSTGYFARATSARKYKKDIEKLEEFYAENFFNNAVPSWYRSRSEIDNPRHGFYGYIADDIAKFEPRLVSYGENGEVEGLHYDRIPVLLHLVMKKDRKRIERLENQRRIELLENQRRIERLENQVQMLLNKLEMIN